MTDEADKESSVELREGEEKRDHHHAVLLPKERGKIMRERGSLSTVLKLKGSPYHPLLGALH